MDDILKGTRALSLRLTMKEMIIFSKWIYRHRNQQRRHKSFQKIVMIERDLKRYLGLDLIMTVKETITHSINSSGLVIKKMELIELASQLSDCTLYCTRLLDLMESAFYDLYQRIETGHLLYSYMMIIASLSRLWFYMRVHVQALYQVHCNLKELLTSQCDTVLLSLSDRLKKEHLRYLPLKHSSSTDIGHTLIENGHTLIENGHNTFTDSLIKRRRNDFNIPSTTDTVKTTLSKRKFPNVIRFYFKGHKRCWKVQVHSQQLVKRVDKFRHSKTLICHSIRLGRQWGLKRFKVRCAKFYWKSKSPCQQDLGHVCRLQQSFQREIHEACDRHVTISDILTTDTDEMIEDIFKILDRKN